MSVSLRPVYRAGRAPSRPPLTLAFAALVGAVALTGVDIAHQVRTGECITAAPVARSAAPVAAELQAGPAEQHAGAQVAEARPAAMRHVARTPRLMDTPAS